MEQQLRWPGCAQPAEHVRDRGRCGTGDRAERGPHDAGRARAPARRAPPPARHAGRLGNGHGRLLRGAPARGQRTLAAGDRCPRGAAQGPPPNAEE